MTQDAPPYDDGTTYSQDLYCGQMHCLYRLLEKRRKEIMADPDFNENNDDLIEELDRTVRRIALIRECFEEFCPS